MTRLNMLRTTGRVRVAPLGPRPTPGLEQVSPPRLGRAAGIRSLASAVCLVAALTLATGCAPSGTGSLKKPLEVDEFLTNPPAVGVEVWVTGAILDDGSGPRLCQVLLESYPPQCNSDLRLTDLPDDWWDDDVNGVRWSEKWRVVHGRAVDEVTIGVLDLTLWDF